MFFFSFSCLPLGLLSPDVFLGPGSFGGGSLSLSLESIGVDPPNLLPYFYLSLRGIARPLPFYGSPLRSMTSNDPGFVLIFPFWAAPGLMSSPFLWGGGWTCPPSLSLSVDGIDPRLGLPVPFLTALGGLGILLKPTKPENRNGTNLF